MNWNILSAIVITLIIMLTWIVLHEEYHRSIYIESGCNVTGIIWNFQTIAGVIGECPGRADHKQIEVRNQIVDGPSQLFGPMAFSLFVLSYLFLVHLDSKEVYTDERQKGGEKDGEQLEGRL